MAPRPKPRSPKQAAKASKRSVSCPPGEHRPLVRPRPSKLELARAAGIFRALGDGERLGLLAQLQSGAACVSELAATFGAEISTVSQRLRVLRSEGLVRRTRRGKHIDYSLADEHVALLVANALAHARDEHSPHTRR